MNPRTVDHDAFVARSASWLKQSGQSTGAIEDTISRVVGADGLAALRQRVAAPPGSFRAELATRLDDAAVDADDLAWRGVAFELALGDAYSGIWRGLHGFAFYLFAVALVASLAFGIMLVYVVPVISEATGGVERMPAFSRLVFHGGLGAILVLLLWLIAGWAVASIATARRAIMLRRWPARGLRYNLLQGPIERHRGLLSAWTTRTLVELGVAPAQAMERAAGVVQRWCGASASATAADDALRLDLAARLGTLPQELEHRIAAGLVDGPLELASLRERLALYGSLTAAALVAPLLVAMYRMFFLAAAMV